MDILRMSAAEKAVISARIEASLADVSDSDEDAADSPEPTDREEEEDYTEEQFKQSKAWQEYIESKKSMDQETEEFISEWRAEVKEMKRTYAPLEIQETAHESSSSSHVSEVFEEVPEPQVFQPEEDIEMEQRIEEEEDLMEQSYQREWEENQMREEDDLSRLIVLYFENMQKQRIEKEKKRLEAEHRRSQEIKLKAQLAVIDSEKKRKREEQRLAEEQKRQAEALFAQQFAEEQRYEAVERTAMKREEMRSIAIETQARMELEATERGWMSREEDYSRRLTSFLATKARKASVKKGKIAPGTRARVGIDCGKVELSVRPPRAIAQVAFPPLAVIPSFPVPKFTVVLDSPAPPGATTLSDSLPYEFSPTTSHFEQKCENLTFINGLSALSELRSLSLTMNQITDIVNLPGRLLILDLTMNKIAKLPRISLPALLELVLDSNLIADLEGCMECRNLRVLSLQNNQVQGFRGVDTFPALQRLNLYRNAVTDQPDDALSRNLYITHLNVGRNRLKKVGFHVPLRLLRSLILYENKIERLAAISGSPLLQEVWLNGNQLPAVDFFTCANALEIVRLDQNKVAHVTPFEARNLHELNISDNDISDFGCIDVILKSAPNLATFECSDNPIWKRVGEMEWALRGGIERKKTENRGNTADLTAGYLRVKYEYMQSELWLRAIARGEIRSDALREELRNAAFALASEHYATLGQKGEIAAVIRFEATAYRYKEYVHRLRKATRLIQCWWRLHLHKVKKLRLKYASSLPQIIRLQAWVRGLLMRKRCAGLRYPLQQVVRIQAWFRGCWLRKRLRRALASAKFIDPELEEIQEMNLEEYTDFDFDLKVPANLDLEQFIRPVEPRFPPIAQNPPSETRSSWSRHSTDSLSDTKSAKSSVPQLPSASREKQVKETLSAWGFQGEDVKRAFNHRLAKKKARKMKEKETTAEERLQRFRRMCG